MNADNDHSCRNMSNRSNVVDAENAEDRTKMTTKQYMQQRVLETQRALAFASANGTKLTTTAAATTPSATTSTGHEPFFSLPTLPSPTWAVAANERRTWKSTGSNFNDTLNDWLLDFRFPSAKVVAAARQTPYSKHGLKLDALLSTTAKPCAPKMSPPEVPPGTTDMVMVAQPLPSAAPLPPQEVVNVVAPTQPELDTLTSTNRPASPRTPAVEAAMPVPSVIIIPNGATAASHSVETTGSLDPLPWRLTGYGSRGSSHGSLDAADWMRLGFSSSDSLREFLELFPSHDSSGNRGVPLSSPKTTEAATIDAVVVEQDAGATTVSPATPNTSSHVVAVDALSFTADASGTNTDSNNATVAVTPKTSNKRKRNTNPIEPAIDPFNAVDSANANGPETEAVAVAVAVAVAAAPTNTSSSFMTPKRMRYSGPNPNERVVAPNESAPEAAFLPAAATVPNSAVEPHYGSSTGTFHSMDSYAATCAALLLHDAPFLGGHELDPIDEAENPNDDIPPLPTAMDHSNGDEPTVDDEDVEAPAGDAEEPVEDAEEPVEDAEVLAAEAIAPVVVVRATRQHKSDDVPKELRVYVEDPNDNDILLGRGGSFNDHPGNIEFHALKSTLVDDYLAATKEEKTAISAKLVEMAETQGRRFLQQEKETLPASNKVVIRWYLTSFARSRRKARQALHERNHAAQLARRNAKRQGA